MYDMHTLAQAERYGSTWVCASPVMLLLRLSGLGLGLGFGLNILVLFPSIFLRENCLLCHGLCY